MRVLQAPRDIDEYSKFFLVSFVLLFSLSHIFFVNLRLYIRMDEMFSF